MNTEQGLSKQMAVRFKRYQKTYFVLYDEYQLFHGLKKKFCDMVNRPVEEVTFFLGDRVNLNQLQQLDTGSTCHDQQIFHDCAVHVLYKKKSGEFEELQEVINSDNAIKEEDDLSDDEIEERA